MTRTWIATAAALLLHATIVSAQVQHFTVGTATDVYKAPTNVSPVIGQVAPGTTVEVTRDVGSWVKVAWAKAPDGVGYIRKAAGTMSVLEPAVPDTPAATTESAPASQPVPPTPVSARASAAAAQTVPRVRQQPAAVPAGYVAPSHRFGLGAQIGGSAMGAGFSARGWSVSQRFGVQLDVTRYSMSNEAFATRTSYTQAGPRVLYAFQDRVSDRTWVRPYAGAGVHVLRGAVADPASGVTMSDTGMAAQIFGGTEVTLAAVPQLGLSADLGYQWYESPFAGASVGGAAFTLSAHWYLK